nr:helix-turn-helix domain-containing protein [Aquidulcibacter paucihalophilus]
MEIRKLASALSSASRLSIMTWLKSPCDHFPPQVHADLVKDGVCGVFIAEKLGMTPATASAHLSVLVEAGLVTSKRLGKWTYFKRNEASLQAFSQSIADL